MDLATATRLTLIKKVSARDQQSWNEFVPLYASLLKNYIHRLGTSCGLHLKEDEVEDVRQDVLVKLWRVLPEFQLDHRGRFRTWLWTVTRNVIIDWVRRYRPGRTTAALAEDLVASTPEPPEVVIKGHNQEVLARILDQVREEMKAGPKWQCFDHHFLQKKPSKEVAQELGVTVSAVNTNTSRVLSRLRELAEYYDLF